MDKTTQIVFIVFTAAILISVVLQSAATLGIFLATRRAQKKIHTLVDDLRIHVLPAARSSRAMIEDLSPKLKVIAANLVDTTNKFRTMSEDVSGVVADVTQRTRAQAAHVDGMLEGTLDQITHATDTIQHGISVPVRHLTGLLNGLRAALNVMMDKTPPSHLETEDDLFI
jgi:hypothetical protein